jgi:hypothetical protein
MVALLTYIFLQQFIIQCIVALKNLFEKGRMKNEKFCKMKVEGSCGICLFTTQQQQYIITSDFFKSECIPLGTRQEAMFKTK